MRCWRTALAAAGLVLLRADMYPDASNAVMPAASVNLGAAASLSAFGGRCDGVADDTAAFLAASVWMMGAAQRVVRLPAGVCTTSATIGWGDGRQTSTALSAGASGSSLSVGSCAGVVAGDAVAVRRDDGSLYRGTTGGCAGAALAVSPAWSGTAASAGALVYTGRISSSNGGGFLGQGAAQDQDASGAGAVTTIRYTGPAAASAATVGVTAAGSRTIVLDSAAGIAMGTPLQAVLDNGDTFWTSARLTPAGTTLYIENEVPAGRSIPAGASILIASNPVVRVSGPIVDPVLTGIHIDAGNLAAIGLELVHVIQGRGTGGPGGVSVANHTGIGGYFRTWPAPFGNYSGSVNGEYEFSALKPANNRAIGLWLLGPALNNMAYSRNRFHGGTLMMGGHDAAAAALRVEHADNNVFLKPFTYYSSGYFTPGNLGAGLYRQASIDGGNFPVENTYYGAAFLGGVTDAPATGVSLGADLFLQYGTGDGEPLPGRTSGPGLSTAGSLFNLKDLSFVSGVSSPATLNFRDPSGTYIWGLGRGGPSANGLSVESLSDVGFYVGAGAIGGGGLALAIDFKRHLRASGPAPALTACGTSPGVVGSDVAGTVTMGTSSPAGCVITFAQPYVAAPICNVSWRGNLAAMGYTTAPASLTLTQTPTSSNKVDYACWAQAGG